MAEIPQDMKKLLFGMGAKWHAIVATVWNCLGLGCLIAGIVGSVKEEGLGMWWPSDWFFLAIAFFVFGVSAWLCAYFAAKEG